MNDLSSAPFTGIKDTASRILYFVSGSPESRATAEYASALRVSDIGTKTSSCVIKAFCPRRLRAYAVRNAWTGAFELSAAARFLCGEWNALSRRFADETALHQAISREASGVPPLFPVSAIFGREDLLVIHTQNAVPLRDFAAMRRPHAITDEYLALCLTIIRRLIDAVMNVHRVCLHLDVTPESVYIDPGASPLETLRADSPFSVRLLDLAAARKKEDLLCAQDGPLLALSAIYTEGFSDTRLSDLETLSACAAPRERYLDQYPIDERSDLFSVAAVAYDLLVGRAPRTDCETFRIALPFEGPLRDDGLRFALEELLGAALRLGDGFSDPASACSEFARETDRMLRRVLP